MKPTNPVLVMGFALVINPSFGQNFTLLESFEDMDSNTVLDSVVQWNSARTDYFILNSGDPTDSGQVTDGNKALEVQYRMGMFSYHHHPEPVPHRVECH